MMYLSYRLFDFLYVFYLIVFMSTYIRFFNFVQKIYYNLTQFTLLIIDLIINNQKLKYHYIQISINHQIISIHYYNNCFNK